VPVQLVVPAHDASTVYIPPAFAGPCSDRRQRTARAAARVVGRDVDSVEPQAKIGVARAAAPGTEVGHVDTMIVCPAVRFGEIVKLVKPAPPCA